LIQRRPQPWTSSPADPAWNGDAPLQIDALVAKVLELEYTLIPNGLHVVGRADERRRAHRHAACDVRGAACGATRTGAHDRAVATGADGRSRPDLADAALDPRSMDLLATEHELDGTRRALDGRFISPAPGGDLLRTPEVLPTGRNLHGFDPGRLPSVAALAAGPPPGRCAARATRRRPHGALPETIGLVLWGTDNLKSEGQPIAQALALLGAEPRTRRTRACRRRASCSRSPRLQRPRIDVVLTVSGVFRDLLPFQIRLLAEAAVAGGEADEPADAELRPEARRAVAIEHGRSRATAALRVFSNDDGAYGANLGLLVESGAWETEEQLADTFVRRKGFAYGPDGKARMPRTCCARCSAHRALLPEPRVGRARRDRPRPVLRDARRHDARREAAARAGVPVYIGDQTRGDGRSAPSRSRSSLETRTRLLNPKWYEGLLQYGHEGVRQVEQHVTNALGLSATTGQVPEWVYQRDRRDLRPRRRHARATRARSIRRRDAHGAAPPRSE
jgi:magnesium chelatase subunit H